MALFLKLIEWKDSSNDTLAYRYPMDGKEINQKSRLTVRESQVAIFVHKGKIADIFEPGQHDLKTEIFPILSKLAGWKYAFQTPVTVDIYFVNTKQFTNVKWGTANPILMRDPEFGAIRVRGYGSFSFRVGEPDVFLKELLGTNASFRTADISDYLKTMLISGITDAIGESKISALDLAGNTLEFNEIVKRKNQEKFKEIGIELTNLFIENMSVPEEVEKVFDERSKLGILGDKTDVMMKISAAEAMKEAAKNPGMGGAFVGAGMGLGAGAGIGQIFGDAFRSSQQQPAAQPAQQQGGAHCPKCNAPMSPKAKFCPECGEKVQVKITCPGCGAEVRASAKFCPECGINLAKKKCPKCGAEVKSGAKFCPECGEKL